MLRIRAIFEQRPQHAAVGREVNQLHPDQLAQTIFQTAGVLHCGLDLGLHLGIGALIIIQDDGVLRGVVIIRSAGGDSGVLGDVAHGRVLETFLTKKVESGVHDFEAGFFGFEGRFDRRHIVEPVQKYARYGCACQEFFERVQFLVEMQGEDAFHAIVIEGA